MPRAGDRYGLLWPTDVAICAVDRAPTLNSRSTLSPMTAVASLLVVIVLSLIVTRMATIALTATGLSRESARFQARSAFTGAGFTTQESEAVVRHPVRRRVVMTLMLMGNAGIAAVVASVILTALGPEDAENPALRFVVLAVGIIVIWVAFKSNWVDRQITRLTASALSRWTDLDVRDYAALLHLGDNYVVTELAVETGDWVAGRDLGTLDLRKEGVIVLGVERPDGTYHGAPVAETSIEPGDVLVVYCQRPAIAELDQRSHGAEGDSAHAAAVKEYRRTIDAEGEQADAGMTPPGLGEPEKPSPTG